MNELGLNVKELNQQVLSFQNGTISSEIYGEGIVLLKNYSKGVTRSGKPKYSGIIVNDSEASFMSWENTAAFTFFENNEISPGQSVVRIGYEIGRFGVVVQNIEFVEPSELYLPESFIYQRYNIPELAHEFCDVIRASGASEDAMEIIRQILHMGTHDDFSKRVAREFAALSHHDACRTGLLAHMTKCLRIYNGIKGAYKFFEDPATNDLMVISLAIHDVGKCMEMYNGTYQAHSFITHRGLGVEHLLGFKDLIVEKYNEEFFYMIFSVIQQHHDEYGEPARTLAAYLSHMIDNLDATLSSIDEMISNESYTQDAAGKKIKFNDTYLNILS